MCFSPLISSAPALILRSASVRESAKSKSDEQLGQIGSGFRGGERNRFDVLRHLALGAPP